jgi:DNA-binding CsgD family transcriptional regulator
MTPVREAGEPAGWLRLSAQLQILQKIEKPDDVLGVMERFQRAYGLAHMTFLVTRFGISSNRYPLLFTTYPRDWTELYADKNYFDVDPVIKNAESAFLPYHWDSLRDNTPKSRAFFEDARSHLVGRHGTTVPIRAANGERSLFSVTSNRPARQWHRQRDPIAKELMVLACFFHEKIVTISGLRDAHKVVALSRRERQCLEHLARGMQGKQIAHALGISDSAVRQYIHSAKRKLGARTSSQAAARAGLIEIIRI